MLSLFGNHTGYGIDAPAAMEGYTENGGDMVALEEALQDMHSVIESMHEHEMAAIECAHKIRQGGNEESIRESYAPVMKNAIKNVYDKLVEMLKKLWAKLKGYFKNVVRFFDGLVLSGKKFVPVPLKRRAGNKKFITIKGASENNLKDIDVKFPLGKLIVVTGVSGSGKSTLVNTILKRALAQKLNNNSEKPGKYKSITGYKNIEKIIDIDQSPIGRTPRSNPATYTSVFDDIRTLFAQTNEAKMRGYTKARFSFNVKGGRCEACHGDGIIKIEMNFLPDVYVPCEVCHGTRYNSETLEVTYREKNIAEVLDMTINEATKFFQNIPKIARKLQTIVDVGLGYVKLGQSATTLSGGEAQRMKLAAELQKLSTGKNFYILDEPTTGLHTDDIKRLMEVLQRLVDEGNTVLIIEHNLDVIKSADWLIDLGPEGGDGGGTIVTTGTPEEVAEVKESYTGQYLKPVLERDTKLTKEALDKND